jgi:hypothetical protein
MRRMRPEILSTAGPSRLRLLGFLATVAGAALVGIAATREWAAVGFAGDVERAADVSVRGTDVWEGKALLLAAAVSLALLVALRLASSSTTRRAVAIAIVALGLASAGIAAVAAVRAGERFGGSAGVDRLAAAIARQTGDAEDVVRDALTKALAEEIRVDVRPAIWLGVAGGLVLALGGGLGLAWVGERERTGGGPPTDVRLADA